MDAQAAINALDRALASAGTDIILRRKSGSPGAHVNQDANVRATVRSYRLRDETLVPTSATAQDDLIVTISPTPIKRQQWPGGQGSATVPTVPVKGDRLFIGGRERNIEVCDPIMIGDVIVRFDIRALG